VTKEYSQTYDIDYDKTFGPMVKMSTMKTLVSLIVNDGWKLHQLDVNNIFFSWRLIGGGVYGDTTTLRHKPNHRQDVQA
jgi:Reverse transcriptase (RNA-dependent DNA polymerase)